MRVIKRRIENPIMVKSVEGVLCKENKLILSGLLIWDSKNVIISIANSHQLFFIFAYTTYIYLPTTMKNISLNVGVHFCILAYRR